MTFPSRRSLILGAGAAFIARPARALIALRNPLLYPGGIVTPGYNQGHLASSPKVRYSGIAAGGNLINLLNGSKATINGTITSARTTAMGSVVVNTTSTSFLSVPSINETLAAATLGLIYNPTALTGANQFLFADAGQNIIFLSTSAGQVKVDFSSGTATFSALVAGTPYFIAVSGNTATTNFVVLNLSNGQIKSQVVTGTVTLGSTTGSAYWIGGSSSANQQMNGQLAAVMFSTGPFLGIAALLEWAAAPWDFWYPPTQRGLMESSLRSPAASGPTCPPGSLTGWGC